jgi:hypothetical protein
MTPEVIDAIQKTMRMCAEQILLITGGTKLEDDSVGWTSAIDSVLGLQRKLENCLEES